MSDTGPGPLHPVAVDLTSEATARLQAETRRSHKRTDRRLAKTAIAVAVVLTTSFCGTGLVANAEQQLRRDRYIRFASIDAENDCCVLTPRGSGVQACANALDVLDDLHEELRTESVAARASAWIATTTGISPELFAIITPSREEIAVLYARCHR